jgi:hypothetical protein
MYGTIILSVFVYCWENLFLLVKGRIQAEGNREYAKIIYIPRNPYLNSLRAGRSGDRILAGARFSAPVQTGPPSLLYNGYWIIPRGKAAGAWLWPPTPSSAEVKVREELYFYSPSGPSKSVLGWNISLPLKPLSMKIYKIYKIRSGPTTTNNIATTTFQR